MSQPTAWRLFKVPGRESTARSARLRRFLEKILPLILQRGESQSLPLTKGEARRG
jgi:hypothetical protein